MTSAAPLPLQQHAYFGNALGLLGRQVHVLALPSAAPVLAVRQFGQLMTSRGPIWQGGAAPSADMLRTSGLRVVNTDAPDASTLTQAGYRMIITPAYVAELDLSRPPNVRINHAKAKWRNIWRRSQDTPVVIKEACFDPANHQWLLDADNRQQRQKRFRGLPHALISAYAACHPQDVPVFVAFEDDTPIAAMLFLLHRPVATYQLGWTSARGRRLGAHHRIIMDAATTCADRGYCRLDLGNVDTDNSPGLARFKIGTGATVRPLGGTWLRIPGL